MKKTFGIIIICFFINTVQAKSFLFVGASFPFILEQPANGEISGVGADIAKEILAKMGQQLKIRIMPWKRAQLLTKNGDADVLIGPYKSIEREDYMDFSKYPFYRDHMVLFVKADGMVILIVLKNINWV